MAKLLKILHPDVTQYKDRRFEGGQAQWERALKTSTTVYVGNTSFFTREEQVYDVFSRVGHIKRVVMGLDKREKTPCGFCFVVYYSRGDAEVCIKVLNGTMLDDRAIRVDHDWGFVEGRQWGRGLSGGQVRDEFRQDYDPGRGGFGKILKAEVDSMTAQMEEGLQGYAMTAPMQGEGGKRRRSGGAGGRGDPSLQAPEQAEEEEEQPIVVHQPGSDNEQE